MAETKTALLSNHPPNKTFKINKIFLNKEIKKTTFQEGTGSKWQSQT